MTGTSPVLASSDFGLAVGSCLFNAEGHGNDWIGMGQWLEGRGVFEFKEWCCGVM